MKPLLIALWAVILAAAPVIAQAEATAPSPVQKIALPVSPAHSITWR